MLYVYKSLHTIEHRTVSFARNQNAFNGRNASNLRMALFRLEKTKQEVQHIGSLKYKNLPEHLRNIPIFLIFKNALKEHLINNIEMLRM